MAKHIWTVLTRGDRDFDRDIDKRTVVAARKHLTGPYALLKNLGTIVSPQRPYYTERVDGIVGNFEQTADGIQEAPPMMPTAVADIKIRPTYYTAALVLSKNRVEDEGFSLIQKLVPKILERGLERMEIDFQNLFVNTADVFNPLRDQRDGVALASVAHPAGPYGATYGNMSATPTALSSTSLSQAVSYLMSVRDDNGDVAPIMAKRFVLGVHPSKLLDAQVLVKSLSSTQDYKNSGVINPLSSANDLQWTVVPLLYATSTTAWFVYADDGEDSGLTVFARKMPTAPKKIIRENPEQVQYFSEMRYGMAVSDPRKFYFNKGA